MSIKHKEEEEKKVDQMHHRAYKMVFEEAVWMVASLVAWMVGLLVDGTADGMAEWRVEWRALSMAERTDSPMAEW